MASEYVLEFMSWEATGDPIELSRFQTNSHSSQTKAAVMCNASPCVPLRSGYMYFGFCN